MKFLALTIVLMPLAIIYILDAMGIEGEETIKPSPKKKALKSQGLLLGALAILGIF
jgi:hypothetical protein